MTLAATILDASLARSEAVRLLEELFRSLPPRPTPGGSAGRESLLAAARTGTLPATLLVGPSGDAIAIALWEPTSELGRRASTIYLGEGFRSGAALGTFLEELDRAPGAPPVLSVEDVQPETLPPNAVRDVLEAHGFRRVVRIDMTWPAGTRASRTVDGSGPSVRPLGPEDEPALARLLDRAYRDNPVDRAMFRSKVDLEEDALAGIRFLTRGELGPWLSFASFGVDSAEGLAAATIVNDFHGALLTEVMVDPAHRRRGLGRAVVAASVEALLPRPFQPIRLVVTLSNERAYNLYRSMGFEPLAGSEGAIWLHAERLGLPSGTG